MQDEQWWHWALPGVPQRPMLPPAPDAKLSAILAGCEATWEAIQAGHDEVPAAVISCASAGPRLTKWGHWWASKWRMGTEARGEVFLAAEGLSRPPEQVVETLVHEAAHALNFARGIRDTSQNGRYHNRRFAAAAEELGLQVSKDRSLGFAFTSFTDELRLKYGTQVEAMTEVMRTYRVQDGGLTTRKDKNLKVALCGCGRKIRAAKGELAEPDIICGRCSTPFTVGGE